MRYINSVYFGRLSTISSIKQAIVLLGEKGIRRFLSLIVMAKLASEKPDELIRTSIIRARFCEQIGKISGSKAGSSEFFILGLFSLIDAILDDSMENLMQKLPLSENIKEALIYKKGEMEDFLNLAIYYEMGNWEMVSETAGKLNLNEEKLPPFFMEALTWADSLADL